MSKNNLRGITLGISLYRGLTLLFQPLLVLNTFPPMLTMSRVGMITTREPQKEIILLRPNTRKIQS